jgi:phosphatidylserine/phosphatidylglycerophosphate/cardiolipin synthase-like enzyme
VESNKRRFGLDYFVFLMLGNRAQIKGTIFFVAVLIVAIAVMLYARVDNAGPQTESLFSYEPAVGQEEVSASAVKVFFCPQDDCAANLVKEIDGADSNIFVAIYSFTHDDIANALIRAKGRGVFVAVVFDSDQSKNASSDDELLASGGILVARRNGSGYMHNKFMVIDEERVATGSFNYSMNADTKNEENLVFIESRELALQFENNFNKIWELADKE